MGKLYKLEPKAAALSPARQRLQDLLDGKAACEQRAESLRIALSRLVDPVKEADAAAAELVAFDQRNADAQLNWARDGLRKTDRPQVDTDARQALIIAKQTTAENASAARSASSQLAAEIHAEDMAAKTFEVPIAATIADILSENVDPLIEDLQKALRLVFEKQSRVKRALEAVINLAHGAGPIDLMKPTFDMAQALSERINSAVVPTVDNFADDMQLWTSFATRLRSNAAAELTEPQ